MDTEVLISAGAIFGLRVIGNMLTTVRLVLMVRGQKLSSSLISILETLIFAVAFGQVVSNLDDLWNLAGYSVGFAVGGYLGLSLEQRLVQRYSRVHIISPTLAHEIAVAVREGGYGATETWGQGAQGQVGSVTVVVGHQQVSDVVRLVHRVDPTAFVVVDELRGISHGYFQRLARPER